MDQTDLGPLLEDLGIEVDSLATALKPLLENPLPTIASKLPLLDKAKLHVLTTYAIESLLFSSLRLSGVDAKEHPVFRELARTRQYFEKIKKIEEGQQKRTLGVDKAAAGRIIKAGLAGNDELDKQKAAEHTTHKAAAKRKAHAVDTENIQEPDVGRAAMLAKRGKWLTASGTTEDATDKDASEDAFPKHTRFLSPPKVSEPNVEKSKSKKSKRHRQKSDKAPKSGHEAFQSLMGRPQGQG